MISEEIKEFLHKEALNRFLRYVQVWTTSDEHSDSNPSTQNQVGIRVNGFELRKGSTRRVWLCVW